MRDDRGLRAVVPAYFHPAADPTGWARLARDAARVRLVVVNVADGPGARPTRSYMELMARLHQSTVDVAGYVDTGYGRRRLAHILAEVARYRDWYGIDAVFLDQVSSTEAQLCHYSALSARARAAGVRVMAFNHGTHPVEGYADQAELLGTFEGPWRAYADASVPDWVKGRPAEQFFHLVYSAPSALHAQVWELVASRGAGGGFVTDHGGANPWDYLPADLVRLPAGTDAHANG